MSLETQRIAIEGGYCWLNPRIARSLLPAASQETVASVCRTIAASHERGKQLKRDHRTHVARVDHDGRRWVVKTYFTGSAKQFVYSLFKLTPAWREWRGAERLARANARCNPPLAMLEGAFLGAGRQTLVFPWVEGITADYLIALAAPPRVRSTSARVFDLRLARSVARQHAALLRQGLLNRDGKGNNLVVDDECARTGGEVPPVMIDPIAIRSWRSRSQLDRLLASMCNDAQASGGLRLREAVAFAKELLRQLGEPSGPGTVRRLARRVERWVDAADSRRTALPRGFTPDLQHPADAR